MAGFRGGFGGREQTAPVSVGDEIEVTIEAVGAKGDGVAKVKGFVLFIPGVKEGEHVKVRVTKVLRKLGFAEVVGRGGEGGGSSEREGSSEEAPQEEESQPSAEDSEDFGEEE